jgi:heme-degrading monooxygenase HmoA
VEYYKGVTIMPDKLIMQIVAAESTPEKEAEFNRWYTEEHVPMLLGFKGLKQASRYRRIGDDAQSAKFLTIYEFESKESMDAFPKSPAFAAAIKDYENKKEEVGFNLKWATSYELIKSWKR